MSTFDADDRDTMGYFLPENSQRRLQKLRDYAEFLSHIAQPRTPDVQQEWVPEIHVEQVAICLELLAEQMGRFRPTAPKATRRLPPTKRLMPPTRCRTTRASATASASPSIRSTRSTG